MSAVLAAKRPGSRTRAEQESLFDPAPVPARAAADMSRAGPTLDELVCATWDGLARGARAACLLCGGALEPLRSPGARTAGGRCRECGSVLG